MADEQRAEIERITKLPQQLELLRAIVGDFPVEEQAVYLQSFTELLHDPVRRERLVLLQQSFPNGDFTVVLAELQPGHAASIWPPRGAKEEKARQQTVLALLEVLRTSGALTVQAVLPLESTDDQHLFEQVGFLQAAELRILGIEQADFPREPPAETFLWESVSPYDSRVAQLLEATYRGSLDCPLVDGWRSISDVIEGYRATGQPLAEGWHIAQVGATAIGCAIVAAHPAQNQRELVYVGVHPAARGAGWGAKMLQRILWEAWEQDVTALMLTVDSANQPALRIYTAAGFRELDRRLILARRLM